MALRFTFQSGDIQITFGQISSTFESAFTFQSGDIQIQHSFPQTKQVLNIYIPIWWYSNTKDSWHINVYCNIYIPIWWYSNPYLILSHIYWFWKHFFVDLHIFNKYWLYLFLYFNFLSHLNANFTNLSIQAYFAHI